MHGAILEYMSTFYTANFYNPRIADLVEPSIVHINKISQITSITTIKYYKRLMEGLPD